MPQLVHTGRMMGAARRGGAAVPSSDPDYFTAFMPQDSWASQVSGPFARYYNGKTYVVFQGPNYDLFCTVYVHATGKKRTYYVGSGVLTTDAHGHGALLVDDQGFLHIFGSCHITPIKYYKSNAAEDPSYWIAQTNVAASGAYPRIFQLSDNSFILFYRRGDHLADWGYQISSDRGATWESYVPILSAGATLGNVTDSWYCNFFKKEGADDIYVSFVWKDDNNSLGSTGWEATQRYNVYYMKRTAAGAWIKADGTSVSTFPVTLTYADASLRILSTLSGLNHTNIPVQAIDSTGAPACLLPVGKTTSHTFKFLKWNGSSWDVRDLPITTDHLFDDYQLELISDTSYRATLTSGGTPGTNGDDDTTQKDRGGNIKTYLTIDSGVNWTSEATLATAESTTSLYNQQRLVDTPDVTAKTIFLSWPQALDVYTGRGYLHGSGGRITFPMEAETKALLNRFSVTPSAKIQNMMDTIIGGLKETGIWDRMDEYWECWAALAPDARLGWKGNYNMLPIGNSGAGPAFTTYRGFKDGTGDSYHDTTFIAATAAKFSQNDAHLSVYINDNVSSNTNDMGWLAAFLGTRNTGNQLAGRVNQAASVSQATITDSSGLSSIQRTAAGAGQFIKNRTLGTTFSNASIALEAIATLQIGKVNGTVLFSPRTIGGGSVGMSLTAKQWSVLFGYRVAWRDMVTTL